jgi:hypothetical protein
MVVGAEAREAGRRSSAAGAAAREPQGPRDDPGRFIRGVGDTRHGFPLLVDAGAVHRRHGCRVSPSKRDIGYSRLGAKCSAGITERDALLCTVYDGTRTRLLTIDAATVTIEPVAYVEGRFFPDDNAVKGWLTGWADSKVVAIHLATKRVLTPPASEKMVTALAPPVIGWQSSSTVSTAAEFGATRSTEPVVGRDPLSAVRDPEPVARARTWMDLVRDRRAARGLADSEQAARTAWRLAPGTLHTYLHAATRPRVCGCVIVRHRHQTR